MLFSKPTKYGTGITIYGDYNDFRELHDFIHEGAKNDRIPHHFQDYLLGFAYEVRKAYEGNRETKDVTRPMPSFDFEKLTYIGFNYFWIHQLLTVRILRWGAAFRPTNLHHHAMLYKLESLTYSALTEYSSKGIEQLWEQVNYLDFFTKDYPLQWIDDLLNLFLEMPNGKKRFESIPFILHRLSPFSKEYKEFHTDMVKLANEKGCSIHSLRLIEEPDINFKW